MGLRSGDSRSQALSSKELRVPTIIILDIQIGTNHMNKNRASVELYKLYTGPASIHMVCPNLYVQLENLMQGGWVGCRKIEDS